MGEHSDERGCYLGRHRQGCVLRDDRHDEPCLTALPPWFEDGCEACATLYGEPRYSCEDLCMTECIGACGAQPTVAAAIEEGPQ